MKESPIICIVDDDIDVRASLENLLRSVGMSVRTFGSAEIFLEEYNQSGVDCVITDLHMPGMDGLALQEQLNTLGRDFPVIMMTAFPTKSAHEQALRLGAAAFLEKPIDPDRLIEQLEGMLSDGT